MNHLNLRRLDTPNATHPTCGHFCTDEEQFICATIELPWHDNEAQKSCIPPTIVGTRRVRPAYAVKYTFSPHFQKKTYELFGVEGRSSIRIHGANYISQLLGCIAPGMTFADINHDGVIDVARSGDALAKLISVVGTNDFTLDIIEPDPQAVAA
jgi:hypothetical protein